MSSDIRCIRRTTKDVSQTWCGIYASPFMKAFPSLDAAAQHGKDKGALVACKVCVAIAIAGLQNGFELHDKVQAQEDTTKFPADSLGLSPIILLLREAGIRISRMRFYRWCEEVNFPASDYNINNTQRWKPERVKAWIEKNKAAA